MTRPGRGQRDSAPSDHQPVARTYARYAASARKRRDWSADNPGNLAIRRELVTAAWALAGQALATADEVLDVGCGGGWWLRELDDDPAVHARLYGVDILPDRVSAARLRVPEATITVCDVRLLPFDDRRFDLVSLFTVLSSLGSHEHVRSALQECWRVVAPGGVLLVWEPRVPNPLNTATLWLTGRELRQSLGRQEASARTTTLMPQLARRLGPRTDVLYPRLARVGFLRTHRLICFGAPRET